MKTFISEYKDGEKSLIPYNFNRVDEQLIVKRIRTILEKDERFAFKEYIMGPSEDVYFYQYDDEKVVLWNDLSDGVEIRASESVLLVIQEMLEKYLEL
ncbi:MAG: hypothetical protein Q4D65_08105 [Peptostreptococcaceae bacterium]|nr:hypothetical protein [Peptostreptococcaceae bacterium]